MRGTTAGTRCGPRGKERRRRFRQDRPSLHRCGGRVRARNSVGVAGLPGQPQGFRHWTGRVGDGAWQADARQVVGRSVEGVCRSSRTDSGHRLCVLLATPAIGGAEDRLRRYAAMFCRTYGDGETLVPFSCESNGVAAPSSEVMGAVLEGRGGALLHGPSGCGKTMLASSSGVALTGRGGVAISVQGKDFVGGLKELMDREAGLLGARSGMQLIIRRASAGSADPVHRGWLQRMQPGSPTTAHAGRCGAGVQV